MYTKTIEIFAEKNNPSSCTKKANFFSSVTKFYSARMHRPQNVSARKVLEAKTLTPRFRISAFNKAVPHITEKTM